jgi:hypothetical protein
MVSWFCPFFNDDIDVDGIRQSSHLSVPCPCSTCHGQLVTPQTRRDHEACDHRQQSVRPAATQKNLSRVSFMTHPAASTSLGSSSSNQQESQQHVTFAMASTTHLAPHNMPTVQTQGKDIPIKLLIIYLTHFCHFRLKCACSLPSLSPTDITLSPCSIGSKPI